MNEKKSNHEPSWRAALLPLTSLVLGGGALWLVWFRSTITVSQPDANWYPWVQTAAIALSGILCLVAAVLFIFDRASGKAMLKTGLSIIPLLLFTNLVIFIARIIQNIIQGNSGFFFDRALAQPQKILFISLIVIALILLGSLSDPDKKEE
jgi:hypothetical protein